MKFVTVLIICLLTSFLSRAQLVTENKKYTHADTLRGSITPERAWWDVLRYDITIKPDYVNKSTTGKSTITYKVVSEKSFQAMQIDLQEPLHIDSILFNNSGKLSFHKEGNVWHVKMPTQNKLSVHHIDVFYSGKPHEAVRPPWDGGWTFTQDSLGRPWMTVV